MPRGERAREPAGARQPGLVLSGVTGGIGAAVAAARPRAGQDRRVGDQHRRRARRRARETHGSIAKHLVTACTAEAASSRRSSRATA